MSDREEKTMRSWLMALVVSTAIPPLANAEPPWEITRVDLTNKPWRNSADLVALGHRIGERRTATGVTIENVATGLELRLTSTGRVERIVVEPEFSDRLATPALRELLAEFSEPRMRALFGIEDTLSAADEREREKLERILQSTGVTHAVREYRYARLGLSVMLRSGNRCAVVLFAPAKSP
jgi:hypothetical protein